MQAASGVAACRYVLTATGAASGLLPALLLLLLLLPQQQLLLGLHLVPAAVFNAVNYQCCQSSMLSTCYSQQ